MIQMKKYLSVITFFILLMTSIPSFAIGENTEKNETILIIGDSLTFHGQYANVLRERITDGKKVVSFGQGCV